MSADKIFRLVVSQAPQRSLCDARKASPHISAVLVYVSAANNAAMGEDDPGVGERQDEAQPVQGTGVMFVVLFLCYFLIV
jgi:hypothetical protein